MTRRRWIQIEGVGLLEVGVEYEQEPEDHAKNHIMGDRHYDGMVSPIDQADISTRTKHREYMRRHGLTTADDFTNTWKEAEKRRAEFYTTGADKTRIADMREAVQMLQQGHRPNRVNPNIED